MLLASLAQSRQWCTCSTPNTKEGVKNWRRRGSDGDDSLPLALGSSGEGCHGNYPSEQCAVRQGSSKHTIGTSLEIPQPLYICVVQGSQSCPAALYLPNATICPIQRITNSGSKTCATFCQVTSQSSKLQNPPCTVRQLSPYSSMKTTSSSFILTTS